MPQMTLTSTSTANFESSVNLTCTFLACGRKQSAHTKHGYSQHKHRPLVVWLYPAGIQTFCLKGAASEKKPSLKVA